jgi:alpha-mannosidase
MKRRVHVIPQTHWDAEVFISREETLAIGTGNLAHELRLLAEQPGTTFVLDQGCLVEPVWERNPELREPIRRFVREGRLEIAGAAWTMPDVNLPCGESFIRNVQRGRRFFQAALGVGARFGWQIDAFGHHPQCPQLFAGCGFDANFFQRLGARSSPTDFVWRGLDGTELRSVWLAGGYAVLWPCPGSPHEFAAMAEKRLGFLEAQCSPGPLLALTGADIAAPEPQLAAMVERYNTSQDRYELVFSTPSRYLAESDSAAKERAAAGGTGLPVLEGDRNPVFTGCNSARIRVKQLNRELETALLDAEKLEAAAWMAGTAGAGADAPAATPAPLLDAWEPVLFNQFHDIICGSHVDSTYRAALGRFAISADLAGARSAADLASLAARIDTSGPGMPVILFNTLGHSRREPVEVTVTFVDGSAREVEVRTSAGAAVPSDLLQAERYGDGSLKKARVLFVTGEVPAFGWEVYRVLPADRAGPATDVHASEPGGIRLNHNTGWVENAHARIGFDLWTGGITSLAVHPAGGEPWEAIAPGSGANDVAREQDYGNFWTYNGPCKGDAFNPEPDRQPLPDPSEPGAAYVSRFFGDAVVRGGRAHAEVGIDRPFGTGQHASRVRLYAGLPRIDIVTDLLNRDERVRYRAVFPTSLAGGTITHEIPFGAIERPEGEFPAQNWIDLSRDGRGLALVNRGLPGNAVLGGTLALALLKCTALKEGYGEGGGWKFGTPTEEGFEKGVRHTFRYSLLPHAGDWRAARLWRAGQDVNSPLIAVRCEARPGSLPARHSLFAVSHPDLCLSALKRTAAGIAVRVYEAAGRAVSGARIEAGVAGPLEVYETDLLERRKHLVARIGAGRPATFSFDVHGFGIRTFEIARPAAAGATAPAGAR